MEAREEALMQTMRRCGNKKGENEKNDDDDAEEYTSSILSLKLSLTASCDGNESSKDGTSMKKEDIVPRKSPAVEVACQVVQKILDQVAHDDAPPNNEESGYLVTPTPIPNPNSAFPTTRYSTQSHVDVQKSRKVFSFEPARGEKDPSVIWSEHYERRSKPSEIKLGQVALATYCARALDTVGKPYLPTSEASSTDDVTRESAGSSPHQPSSSSPKKAWFRRKKPAFNNDDDNHAAGLVDDSGQTEQRDDGIGTRASQGGVTHESSNRLRMFGSEYARFLSGTILGPNEKPAKLVRSLPPRDMKQVKKVRPLATALEDAGDGVLTGAVTDIVITYNNDAPPKGYFRISESGSGERLILGEKKGTVFINVKKEANWDRAAQRPCVTAITVIFPERREFVPPGFCVARLHRPGRVKTSGESTPANLNYGGEQVFLCFRRSREQNPITGIIPLKPSKQEPIPEGYTVIEHSPRNFVATLSKTTPTFLAYRQRLANLETLRPLPLVLAVHSSPTTNRNLKAYFCTGGTVVHSNVGKFHVMDRSTHSLLSPSSISNRLAVIEASRQKALLSSMGTLQTGMSNTYRYSTKMTVPSPSSQGLTSSLLLLEHGLRTPSNRSTHSDYDRFSTTSTDDDVAVGTETWENQKWHNPNDCSYSTVDSSERDESEELDMDLSQSSLVESEVTSDPIDEMQRCMETLSFIPVVSSAVHEGSPTEMAEFQARATILTPILTACYTRHGGSTLIAVDGLSKLLNENFFAQDVSMKTYTSPMISLLDIAIQTVCDVATSGAQETQMHTCVEFVERAMEYGCGYLSTRTVGYAFRFYLFIFYFGACIPTRGLNPVVRTGVEEDPWIIRDERLTSTSKYLTGGASQSAALAMKDLIQYSIRKLQSLNSADLLRNKSMGFFNHSKSPPPEEFNIFLDGLMKEMVDDSMHRVEIANYLELSMHQIHRSGGSELFWYDMMNSCGNGMFGDDKALREETRRMFSLCFTILANLVKVASAPIRRGKDSIPVARDVAGKLLSMELILVFLQQWSSSLDAMDNLSITSKSVSTFHFCIRRLVVPCLILTSEDTYTDPRLYRRVTRIVGHLCCTPSLRDNMRLEIGILFDHFVLKFLELRPHQLCWKKVDQNDDHQSAKNLLHQQVHLLNDLSSWFSDPSFEPLSLYSNFDAQSSENEHSAATQDIFLGEQWELTLRLCKILCNLIEECNSSMSVAIKESEHLSSGLRSTSANPSNSSRDAVQETEAIEAAGCLRAAAVKSLATFTKVLSRSVAMCSSRSFFELVDISSSTTVQRDPASLKNGKILSAIQTQSQSKLLHQQDSRSNVLDFWEQEIMRRNCDSDCSSVLPSEMNHGSRLSSTPQHEKVTKSSKQQGRNNLYVAFDLARSKKISKAIDFLIAVGHIRKSPRDIASFLRIHKGEFSSKDLGTYLGEVGPGGSESEFWNSIRFYYIRANSFVGMGVEKG